jgi:hypothetical protein
MNSFIYGTLPQRLQRATRLRCMTKEGESRWTRTALVTESPLNCDRWLSLSTMRFLSSARPLPEDQLPNHHLPPFWNESPSESRTSKRASLAKLRRNSPRIEKPKSPSPNSAINVDKVAPVMDVTNALRSQMSDDAFFNAHVQPEALAAFQKESPKSLRYTGDAVIPITSVLHIVKPQEDVPRGIWPVFRLMVSSSP